MFSEMLGWLGAVVVLLPFALLAAALVLTPCYHLARFLCPTHKPRIDAVFKTLFSPILPTMKVCIYALFVLMILYLLGLFLGIIPPTPPDR